MTPPCVTPRPLTRTEPPRLNRTRQEPQVVRQLIFDMTDPNYEVVRHLTFDVPTELELYKVTPRQL